MSARSGYRAIAAFYDALADPALYARYAEYIDDGFKRNGVSGDVLDAGCGTGRMTALLQKRGYDLIGVDASVDMLAIARHKLAEGTLLLHQQLTELDLYGTVSAAVSTLDVVNHLPTMNAVRLFFERVALFMERGGIFIFDMNLPYKHESILGDNAFVYEISEGMLVWQNRQLSDGSGVEMALDFFIEQPGGSYRRETDLLFEYTYLPADIEHSAGDAGFMILDKRDGETFLSLEEMSQRAVYTLKKE